MVSETATGETAEVVVTTDAPKDAVVPAEGATIDITNTVEFRPGSLAVTKVITGPAAGQQGEITLRVVCADVLDETVVIPAATAAGSYQQTFSTLPAGTECTVTEAATGANAFVQIGVGDPVTVAIEPGATVEAVITNTVEPVTPVTPDEPATPANAVTAPFLATTGAGPNSGLLVAAGALATAGSIALLGALLTRHRRGTATERVRIS